MIYRKPFENGSNPGREREEAVLRGVSRWFEPREPWLARRNGISLAFRSRHMGNFGPLLRALRPCYTKEEVG
jgi:hypothetical protein